MLALADRRAWFGLQSQIVDHVHRSWLPQVPPELCLCARRSVAGRRWLANLLSKVGAPLFGLPAESGPSCAHDLHRAEWLTALLRDPTECALDLGAMAFAPAIRTTVSRPLVSRLSAALGCQRYERVLHAPQIDSTKSSPSPEEATELLGASSDIVTVLTRRGAYELAVYALSVHAALGESVKFCFECNWWDSVPAPLLPSATAEFFLRSRCPDAEID